MSIHPSAAVDPGARIGCDVRIGPFCMVGADVSIGDGCVLMPHVQVDSPAAIVIGRKNVFHPTAAVGGPPQDLQPPAEDGRIEIGDNNVFREMTSVHAPKSPGGVTRVGSGNHFFYSSHVGHDAEVGDDVLLDNGFVLGGHSCVESGARCGPHGGTHQFATVGKKARVRSHIPVTTDVPPYMDVDGNHYRVIGVNRDAVRGLPPERILALEDARVMLFESGLPRGDALDRLEPGATPEVAELIDFVRRSMRGRMGRGREARR